MPWWAYPVVLIHVKKTRKLLMHFMKNTVRKEAKQAVVLE